VLLFSLFFSSGQTAVRLSGAEAAKYHVLFDPTKILTKWSQVQYKYKYFIRNYQYKSKFF